MLFLISTFSVLKKKIFLITSAKLISGQARNNEDPEENKKRKCPPTTLGEIRKPAFFHTTSTVHGVQDCS